MDLNVVPVWRTYTGRGVSVGVIDDSVEYTHPDLNDNYNTQTDVDAAQRDDDPAPYWFDDNHGTAVAGLIAAEANNQTGGVGVAPDATLSGIRIDFYDYDFVTNATYAFEQMANFDVVNNSWGYFVPFSDSFITKRGTPTYGPALELAAANGREGLGTVIVFSAGNDRQSGNNANYSNLNNSRFTIAVAALTHTGVHTNYSSPGSNVLVSAFGGDTPADGIVTTDRQGGGGYSSGDYTDDFGGTSSAAPMVSGVVALMLEANSDLGYRDVQEILAYSARQTDRTNPSWLTNAAQNWNGGGLHVSQDYGFGLVDARTAVRLAETWQTQRTLANEVEITAQQVVNQPILDNTALTDTLTLTQNLDIDQVEVVVDIAHSWIGDLELVLTSPSGTESVLMARPGQTRTNPFGLSQQNLQFRFSSVQFWGESSAGDWTLTVRDQADLDEGALIRWSLSVFGDVVNPNDVYIYTDAFGRVGEQATRSQLVDDQGNDTLNAAAVTSPLRLNLRPGATSQIAGRSLTLAAGTVIESAIGGDRQDVVRGNAADNTLQGGGARDRLFGRSGDDLLQGQGGRDLLNGGNGSDTLVGGADQDVLLGGAQSDVMQGGGGRDRFRFSSPTPFSRAQGIDQILDFGVGGSDFIVLSKTTFSALTSRVGRGFSQAAEFARVATDRAVAGSRALVVYSQATGNLFYNENGSGAGLGNGGQIATLVNTPQLRARDVALVA